jgi:hypothetical protein
MRELGRATLIEFCKFTMKTPRHCQCLHLFNANFLMRDTDVCREFERASVIEIEDLLSVAEAAKQGPPHLDGWFFPAFSNDESCPWNCRHEESRLNLIDDYSGEKVCPAAGREE